MINNSIHKKLTTMTQAKPVLLIALLLLTMTQVVWANPSDLTPPGWQPVASDKLLKLPATIIEKRVKKDFQSSTMAKRMVSLEVEMKEKVAIINSILKGISSLEGETAQDQRYELLEYKSEYLDLLQESHTLHQSALQKRQGLYTSVLNKMRFQSGKNQRNESFQIQQAQKVARQRMEKVIVNVDQSLKHLGIEKSSPYSNEYSHNLDQIKKLQLAINRHQTNQSPKVAGVDISAEEYLRQLLMAVSTEQSLLDQESLMLSYMAKLVALDAQSLEYEMAYNHESDPDITSNMAKPSSVTTLFYQE